jgi:DNA-binding transcriptional MerR regulator
MEKALPSIPAKRYFTIGEVSDLCGVKPHVLRYWEQEFTQLRPMKRRGNRRYYQHHEVLMIRRIRDLLYDQGFTISGARNKLQETGAGRTRQAPGRRGHARRRRGHRSRGFVLRGFRGQRTAGRARRSRRSCSVRRELFEIRDLLRRRTDEVPVHGRYNRGFGV